MKNYPTYNDRHSNIDANYYLDITDLKNQRLTASLGRGKCRAIVRFEAPDLTFKLSDLCKIKKWLSSAIASLRPRLKNLKTKIPNGSKIRVVMHRSSAKLVISPRTDMAVFMTLKNLMQSRRNIADCIVEMTLALKEEKAYLKRLHELDKEFAGFGHKIRRGSTRGWGG